MALTPDIIIVSSEEDIHAQAVVNYLHETQRQLTVSMIDTSQFPQQMACKVVMNNGRVQVGFAYGNNSYLCLDRLRSIWWWRPQFPTPHNQLQDAHKARFAYTECCQFIEGLWYVTDCLWVNHPERQDVALNQLYQLEVAQKVGFCVPETLISSSPESVREFWERKNHGLLYKPMIPLSYRAFPFTEDMLKRIENISFAPLLFQANIRFDAYIRVVVIGDAIYAVRIYDNSSQDNQQLPYVKKYDLPSEIITKIQNFMSPKYTGLLYCKLNLGLDPDGHCFFLDMDPTATFQEMEKPLNVPLAQAVGQLLLRGKKNKDICWPVLPGRDSSYKPE